MPIVSKDDRKELERYRQFVADYPGAHFYQDPGWTRVKRMPAEYVYIEKDGEIVAACTVYIRHIVLGKTILYGQRGPLCNLYDKELFGELLAQMEPLVKRYRAFMIKFDPNIDDEDKLRDSLLEAGCKIRGKGYSKLDLILSRRSMALSLTGKDLTKTITGFKTRTRRDIYKSQRSGLEVESRRDKEALDEFMALLGETAARNGIEHKPRVFFEDMLSVYPEAVVRLYLVKKDEVCIAGAIAVNYGSRLYYYHSGSSDSYRELYPNHFLQYQLIDWAIASGCEYYDMGGIIKQDPGDGLYKFKVGFCKDEGLQEYLGEIDIICQRFYYYIFNLAYKIIQRIRRYIIYRHR